jgi:amino acid transporter
LTIGVGTMIGAGIFVLPSIAADKAGPAAAVAFLIGGVIAFLTAMSASELGTAMPKAGGSYYFVNHALGPVFGSVAGWGNWIGLAFASAFYCIGFGGYVTTWFPVGPEYAVELGLFTLKAEQIGGLLAGGLFIGVNYIGAKETGRLQNIIVITLIGILSIFIAGAFFQSSVDKLMPFAPNGYDAILPTTGIIFVSFLGFAKITTVAEEIRDPGRNLPLAVMGSVALVTLIYVVVMLVLTGAARVPLPELGDVAVVEVGKIALGVVGGVMMTVGGLLATASSANASILASSRINFAMGRDRLVSDWLNDIHDKFSTPHRSIAITGVLILLFILYGDVKTLAKAGSVLHLIVYGCINLALIVMRMSDHPDYDPDYRVPLYPIVPILGAVTSFGLIGFMDTTEQLLSLAFVGLGIVWYLLYARNHTEKRGVISTHILETPERVPAKAQTEAPEPSEIEGPRIMVPLANPEHEQNLITIAAALAKQQGGKVVAVHIATVPDQTALEAGAEHINEIDAASGLLLDQARRDAETLGVEVETHTIVSHRGFEEVFDAAETQRADTVVLGWGPQSHGSPGRAEGVFDDLAGDLPCDFVVFKDMGFDPSKILIPTTGGPDSEVSAVLGRVLHDEFDSEVTLLHLVGSDEERDEGEMFLETWGKDHAFERAERRVEVGDDAYESILDISKDYTLMILGATEKGILRRLTERSGISNVVEESGISVLLAEQARHRSLAERLFGSSSSED